MSITNETVARKAIAECEKFREFTDNLINKDYCYNDMQRHANQLESALKEFKYCLYEVINHQKHEIEFDLKEMNAKLAKNNAKIEQVLSAYHAKLDGFKAARDEHREDFIKMFDELRMDNQNGDLLDEDFKYCSYITDEAFCDLAIAVIMQHHYEIQGIMKELEGKTEGLVIEFKLCIIPLFFKELNSFV